MTDYKAIQDRSAFDIVATVSNLFVCGIGFAFYGDTKRFVKYFLIGLLTGAFTFGVGYLIASIVATVKCWKQE